MADVTFHHGNPVTIDYTPSSGNVALGQVVLIGSVTANTGGGGARACVASRPIANNVLGSLDAGGGVYSGINLNNAANGVLVYWDDTNNKFTTASTNNAVFGQIVKGGGGGANSTCYVLHDPRPAGVYA